MIIQINVLKIDDCNTLDLPLDIIKLEYKMTTNLLFTCTMLIAIEIWPPQDLNNSLPKFKHLFLPNTVC